MSGLLRWLFPGFCTKEDLEASRKSLLGDISLIKEAVLGEQEYTDKNFHILASKIDHIDGQIKALGAKPAGSVSALPEFKTLVALTVQNHDDLAEERAKYAAFEKKLSDLSSLVEAVSTQLNSTKLNPSQLTQLNSVNSTKLNSTKLNWKRGMTAMTNPKQDEEVFSHASVSPGAEVNSFKPEKAQRMEEQKRLLETGDGLKMTQGHYSVLFVLYNLQADLGSRAVSLKTVVKELYGEKSGHSKESFASRIVRELDACGLVVKGPRGRTTRVYLSKEGVAFCKSCVLARKENSQ